MTLVKFKYVTRDRDRHGNVRFYFRKPGKPKVRLPGLPGSDDFLNAYRAALGEGKPVAVERSFEWLCGRYYWSAEFQALEEDTRRRKRSVLDEICNIVGGGGRRLGQAPFASLKRMHVRQLRDMKASKPEGANFRVKQISALYAWAIRNEYTSVNPAEKVEKLGGSTDGYYTWTEEDVEAFEAHWPLGSRPRLAMAIMLYLGVRRSDAVRIGRKHESRDGMSVSFTQFKGRKNGGKILTLSVLPPLREILSVSELGTETWLETSFGKSYSAAGFGNAFSGLVSGGGAAAMYIAWSSQNRRGARGRSRRERARAYGDVWLGRRRHGARLYAQGRAKKAGCERGCETRVRAPAGRGHRCPTFCPTFKNR